MENMVVSGSASGIGAATYARLEAAGTTVIGIDLHNAEVEADLSTEVGREMAVARTLELTEGCLDGLVACAGVGPQISTPDIASINYFGAVALLEGLRPALVKCTNAAAVAVSSNSARLGTADEALVTACLEGDEPLARELATRLSGDEVYPASKLALARWVRTHATDKEWIGQGVRLNAVAPGVTDTPLVQNGLEDPEVEQGIRAFPIPIGRFAEPSEIAAAIVFLLGPEASFVCGSVVYIDGGSDALFRPHTF